MSIASAFNITGVVHSNPPVVLDSLGDQPLLPAPCLRPSTPEVSTTPTTPSGPLTPTLLRELQQQATSILQTATLAPKKVAPFVKGAVAFANAGMLATQRLAERTDAQMSEKNGKVRHGKR